MISQVSTTRGLGAYPDQVWYDPNRPSWLPGWIDTPTESIRKIQTLAVGNPAGNTMQPGEVGVSQDTLNNAKVQCVASSGTWDENLQICAPDSLEKYFKWGALALGGLVVVGMFFKR